MKRILFFLILMVVAFVCEAGMVCAGEGRVISIATGSKLGTYYRFGNDIAGVAQQHGVTVKVLNTEGSLDNLERMKRGRADLAIVQSDVIGVLYQIDPDFVNDLRVVFPLYPEEIHILARKNISGIEDLSRKKVATGTEKSGNNVTMMVLLNKMIVAGVEKVKDLSPKDAVTAVLTGDIDAMAYVSGKPADLFTCLNKLQGDAKRCSLMEGIHFLPLQGEKLIKQYYSATEIGPADYPWMKKPVPTVSVQALLVKLKKKTTEGGCDRELLTLVDAVRSDIETLKKTGHPKWSAVDLGANLPDPWNYDTCVDFGIDAKGIKSIFD